MNRSNTMTNTFNRNQRLLVMAGACLALGVSSVAFGQAAGGAGSDSGAASLVLTGTIRDFKERSVSNGHQDFELNPSGGFGHYVGQVSDTLGENRKPVYASAGYKVTSEWKDSAGRNRINNKSYIASKSGDVNGAKNSSTGGAMSAGASGFAQWFSDVPGVNSSKPLSITLNKPAGSNIYTFNDRVDPAYSSRGGFFPINGELFGNSAGGTKNFHFTFELATEFIYKRGTGQVFTFTGDDDVWVFIDNKLVIDIGGIHGAVSQTIDLDRLSWLVDNGTYSLNFFFAERHRTESNCRIDTTLQLRTVEVPSASGLYD